MEKIELLQIELDKLRVDRAELEQRASDIRQKIEDSNLTVVNGRVVDKGGADEEVWAVVYHWVLYSRFDKETNKNICHRWRGAKELSNEEYERIKKAFEEKNEIEEYLNKKWKT